LAQEADFDMENNPGGRPKKLTPYDQRDISSMIHTGKASTTTQPTEHINTIILDPVCTQTVRNVLHDDTFKAHKKPKRPKLTKAQK
jgi:hypothetical protein